MRVQVFFCAHFHMKKRDSFHLERIALKYFNDAFFSLMKMSG